MRFTQLSGYTTKVFAHAKFTRWRHYNSVSYMTGDNAIMCA